MIIILDSKIPKQIAAAWTPDRKTCVFAGAPQQLRIRRKRLAAQHRQRSSGEAELLGKHRGVPEINQLLHKRLIYV